jgi:glycerol-3-phosphate cytidylyltransferase-like family protein
MNIYIPMTVNVLTPGHIKVLENLAGKGFVTIGLLTAKALEGYKKERQPYEDRLFILESLMWSMGGFEVIPQDSLDPSANLKRGNYHAFASGDGFEEVEEEAIRKYKLKKIKVKLPGEITKKYSSSKI